MAKLALTLLVIAAIAAAAITANLALLRYASSGSDPVGHLSPHLKLPAAPAQVLPPVNKPPDNEGADD